MLTQVSVLMTWASFTASNGSWSSVIFDAASRCARSRTDSSRAVGFGTGQGQVKLQPQGGIDPGMGDIVAVPDVGYFQSL